MEEPRRMDDMLFQLVQEWPPTLYDVSKIVALLLDQLLHLPDNQTLLRALATLYRYLFSSAIDGATK